MEIAKIKPNLILWYCFICFQGRVFFCFVMGWLLIDKPVIPSWWIDKNYGSNKPVENCNYDNMLLAYFILHICL